MTDTLVSHQVGITLWVGVIWMCENLYFGMGRWGWVLIRYQERKGG